MDNIISEIKVSVIMPIYNASEYLCPAIDSVLYQTLPEIELICVDDGSQDNSLEILKEYQSRDDRVRIVTETNAGAAIARNNGMRRARGEYIAFLDADDFVEPTFLEALYETAKQDSLDIAICAYDMYNVRRARFEEATDAEHANILSEGVITSKKENPDHIFTSTVNSPWNKLFKRSFIESKGLLFLSNVKMYEDVYFVVTALALAERVEKIPILLMHHRIHLEQARTRMFKKYHNEIPFVYLKIKEFLTKKGLYAPLSTAFLNLSASRCFRIYNLLSGEAKEAFWNLLHSEYALALGWEGREMPEFESEDVYLFALGVSLYDYGSYKKRKSSKEQAGIKKQNEKKRGFLSKIFTRKSTKAKKQIR